MPTTLRNNLAGKRFGRLKVLGYRRTDDRKQTYWLCRCDCGQKVVKAARHLKTGKSASCGCLRREVTRQNKSTHGMARSAIYRVWRAMLNRCYLKTNKAYRYYGKKGVQVCERWRHSFAEFYKDMGGAYRAGLWLDREDTRKNYTPENCRWVTAVVQQRNRTNNRRLTLHRKTRSLAEWAELFAIDSHVISKRLRRGWPLKFALTLPVNSRLARHSK